ncbi:TPA: hypothetical protein ACGPQK_002896 [Pseudomonas aeruginosa]
MLVYVNSFRFQPERGLEQIIQLVAKWVGQRTKSYVDGARLAEGIHELRLKDGSTLSSRVTLGESKEKLYPYLFCAQLGHRDGRVSGRKWVTEVGLRQGAEGEPIECSLLLRTEEVSARVVAPIQVTRPKLVEQLINTCKPLGRTPGLNIKQLNLESADAHLHEVEREGRDYPIVIMSTDQDGKYPVEPERLRSILVGLAELVCVPADEDTFAIQEVVGRRYVAFGGAIKVLFSMRQGERERFCESVLMHPDDIIEHVQGGSSVESEVLALITHRTNLPYSWRHISNEKVGQAVLRAQLSRVILRAKSSEHSAELSEYIALLEEADQELRTKDQELAQLRADYASKDQEARTLQADITGLKHALNGRQAGEDDKKELAEALTPLRDVIVAAVKGDLLLQQVLDLVATLYADRVIVLDSARTSAKESDRGGFRQGMKAFELLQKLVSDYWQCLIDGKGDQQAKAVFGQNAYAANEASALSNDGKRRRTFTYQGRDFLMEKHLKHGVKDSLAETLRVHFEWIGVEKRIVIGHCGKHLDF